MADIDRLKEEYRSNLTQCIQRVKTELDNKDGNQKKLTVSGEEIESAVNSKHEHSNSAVLDKLSDNNGTLQYNGADITGGSASEITASKVKMADNTTVEDTVSSLKEDLVNKASINIVNGISSNVNSISENLNTVTNFLYKLKGDTGLSVLKDKFNSRVDEYIAKNGLKINGADRTREEIADWMLNRDNCLYRGKLYKNGKYLTDVEGKQVEIRGIGTHHLLQFNNLHTKECLETLKYYGINCIRLSAYLYDYTYAKSNNEIAYGYLTHPEETKAEMDRIIEYCIELGLYVLIDWHVWQTEGNKITTLNQKEAEEFFTYFSQKYANVPNIMYELANEPYQINANDCLDYIKAIRNILVTNVEKPIMIMDNAKDGVEAMYNLLIDNNLNDIFISLHQYGYLHVFDYNQLFEKGYPLFITEWGNSMYDGDGQGNDVYAREMLKFYHDTGIPNSFWKYTDQDMATSILKNVDNKINNEIYKYGGFLDSDLSSNGKLFLGKFEDYAFKNWINREEVAGITVIDTIQYKEYGVTIGLSPDGRTIYGFTTTGLNMNTACWNIPITQGKYYKLIKTNGNRFRAALHTEKLTKPSSDYKTCSTFKKLVAYDDNLNKVTFYNDSYNYLTVYYSTNKEIGLIKLIEISKEENTEEKTYNYVTQMPTSYDSYKHKGFIKENGLLDYNDTVYTRNICYINIPVQNGKTYNIKTYGYYRDRFRLIYSDVELNNKDSGTIIIDDNSINDYTYECTADGYISLFISDKTDCSIDIEIS